MSKEAEREILDVLESYFSSYEKLEFDTCRKIWDSTHPKLTWKPTEDEEAMVDFDAISTYLDANHAIDLQVFRPSEVKVIDFVRDDVAFVFAHMICKFDVPDSEQTRSAQEQGLMTFAPGDKVRWKGTASFVLHKVDGSWKLIHYEDSTPWDLKNNYDG